MPAPGPATVIVRQRIDQRVPIVMLVGALPQRAAQAGRQLVQRRQQAFQICQGERAQLAAGQAEMLGQPEQPPGAVVDRVCSRLLRYRTVLPGPDHVGEAIPVGSRRPDPLRKRGRERGDHSPPDQRPGPAGQILRQPSLVQGVPHQRLRRAFQQISAQCGQRAFQAPMLAAELFDPQTVETQTQGEIIGQRDRCVPIGRIAGMTLTPIHHPGPAGQFQGEAGEITLPA